MSTRHPTSQPGRVDLGKRDNERLTDVVAHANVCLHPYRALVADDSNDLHVLAWAAEVLRRQYEAGFSIAGIHPLTLSSLTST